MTVVLAAGVVPVKTERVHVTVCRVSKRKSRVRRVHGVIHIEGLSGIEHTGNAFTSLLKNFRNRYGPRHAALLNPNRPRFDAKEFSNDAA